MRLWILATILLITTINQSYADVIINEIMYNPSQNENYNEWIELYNNGTEDIDIINWTLCGDRILSGYLDKNTTLFLNTTTIINHEEYAIISDGGTGTEVYDNFNVSNYSVAFNVDANSLCSGGLSNSGKTITLSDGSSNFSVTYTNSADEGYSLERVNGSFIESLELGGTPGSVNTGTPSNESEDDSNETEEGDIKIDIGISKTNFSLADLMYIAGNITNTFNSSKNANLTIKVARNINGTWKYKWYITKDEELTVLNETFLNYSWTLPDDLIKGDYKVLATLYYDDTYTSSGEEFYVNGLEDLGEYNLTLVESPNSMGFGEISKVVLRLDSNNYNIKNASFVAYFYEPRWASIDFDDNTLMTRPYDTDAAVKFENISRATTTYIAVPLLSKRNCDGDFSDGVYKGKARFYEGSEDILEQEFYVSISGVNSAMCPQAETKYVTKSSSSKTAASAASEKETTEEDELQNFVFSYDSIKFDVYIPEIAKEGIIEINVTAKNPTNETKTFEVYSYILSGKKLLGKERRDNRKELKLDAGETKSITLTTPFNADKEDAEYKAYLKINSSNRKSEKSISKSVFPVFGEIKNKEALPKISKFYTRAKKYNEEITVTVGCDDFGNKSDYKLNLYSFDEYKSEKCNDTLSFKIKINEGNNLFFLTLEKNSTVYDIKKMIISANETDIHTFSDNALTYNGLDYNELLETAGPYRKNLITGNAASNYGVIYESSSEKVKKLIKYIVPTVFIIGIVLYLRRDKLVFVS